MKRIIIASLVLTLPGCAYQSPGAYERPDGTQFRVSRQKRIASASHWNVVANNEAKLLVKRVGNQSVFVEKINSSSFSDTYHNLLTSGLVSNGAVVLTADKWDSVKVSYNVNIVNHEWGRPAPDPFESNKGLVLTELTHYVFKEAVGIIKAPNFVVAEEMFKNLSSVTEVVITTRATQDDQLLYSSSNVYYIDGRNQMEYAERPRMIVPVVTPKHRAGDVVSLKVVGDDR